MKKILFLTNYPSPYRVEFFDRLGEETQLTVLYSERAEEKKHRSADWFVANKGSCQIIQLNRFAAIRGRDLCLDVTRWLKKNWDAIVLCGYSSPTVMLAMAYLRLNRIPFYMEVDGGLVRQDSGLKYGFKKLLVSAPTWWISSGRHTTDYLVHYGADPARIFTYPFTSLWQKDILQQAPTPQEKQALREKLGIREEKAALYVGRYDRKKGMEDLLEVSGTLDRDTGVYFVGGEPTQTHLDYCKEHNLDRVHFIGFQRKEHLAQWYRACDVLVLPTKSDVWGLVINEAMSFGLPVITTDRCVAGLELVENGVNGYLVPVDDNEALARRIRQVLGGDYQAMGRAALEKIRPYTIENMARAHVDIFERRE